MCIMETNTNSHPKKINRSTHIVGVNIFCERAQLDTSADDADEEEVELDARCRILLLDRDGLLVRERFADDATAAATVNHSERRQR